MKFRARLYYSLTVLILFCGVVVIFFVQSDRQRAFVEDVMRQRTPLVYVRHVHMVNFTSFGVLRAPLYVNLVREPLDRLVSDFYFKRNNIRGMYSVANVSSFDECVSRGVAECVDPSPWGFFKIIPYFCGQASYCRKPSQQALAVAKRNVGSTYTLVGIMEELDHFFMLLEHILPSFFRGIREAYSRSEQSLRKRFRTRHKVQPRSTTRESMKQLMSLEYEFYNFIKQRFDVTFRKLSSRDSVKNLLIVSTQ